MRTFPEEVLLKPLTVRKGNKILLDSQALADDEVQHKVQVSNSSICLLNHCECT
jgi:hypothetical protein